VGTGSVCIEGPTQWKFGALSLRVARSAYALVSLAWLWPWVSLLLVWS